MAKDKTKRKLIAVVHADVKGYSRLMQEDDEYTVRTLASNRKEMYRLVKIHKGHVRDTAGDGFLVEFPSVVDAVKFSVEFQREMKKRNEDVSDDRKMEFRIGVNIGDVIHDGATIHGDGVNVAARLEGLADPGGICISVAAFEQVKKKLDVGFQFIGDKTVKNIAEPVPTYKVLFDSTEPPVSKEKSPQIKSGARRKVYLIAPAVVILAIASSGIYYFHFYPAPASEKTALEQAPALPLPDKPSIAVLPFDNMSGDPKQEYFSDGITEEIITGLSKIPKLFVIARNSSFAFKDKHADVREVGHKLGVRYVLEGSVRKRGNLIRITVQLIDAQTGGHLWSERYDRELKDIFDLQDEITRKIMMAMQIKLTIGEQGRLWGKNTTENMDAYVKTIEARVYVSKGSKEGNVKALQLAKESLALDPGYAPAYATLAAVHMVDAFMGWSENPRASGREAYEMANKCIALDERLDAAHYVLGLVYGYLRQYDMAIAEAERAVQLNPNGAEALNNLGLILNWSGRPKEAIPIIQKAMRLNPMPPAYYYQFLGVGYLMTKQYDKAIALYKKALQLQPDHAMCLLHLTATYSLVGKREDASNTAAKLLELNPKFSVKHWEKMLPWKDRDVAKQYIDALRKVGLK